jgi:hypothetical protein
VHRRGRLETATEGRILVVVGLPALTSPEPPSDGDQSASNGMLTKKATDSVGPVT